MKQATFSLPSQDDFIELVLQLLRIAALPLPQDILSYWRDDAAHGMASPISAPEAEEALRQLLMFVQFAGKHWKELVA